MEAYIGIYAVSVFFCLLITIYEFFVSDLLDFNASDYFFKVFNSFVPVLNTIVLLVAFGFLVHHFLFKEKKLHIN